MAKQPFNVRVAKAVLFFLGGLATVGFLITKSPTALAWATSGQYRYGDLYRFAQIKKFQPTEPQLYGPDGDIDSVDRGGVLKDTDQFIVSGDSFSFIDAGYAPFHAQLARQLGTPVFSVYRSHRDKHWTNPYLMLESAPHRSGPPRVLFLEVVERLIPGQFLAPMPAAAAERIPPEPSLFQSIQDDLLQGTEFRHEVLLKHSFLTAPLVTAWNSLVFDCFGQIPAETPWYSLQPPFLFFRDEINSFQAPHDDPLIASLADHIAELNQNLLTRYNCILVFIPIPNKVTVYSRLATAQSYDEFLPRLCRALKARGVCTVELLSRFQQEKAVLYWPTDTHWNNLGIQVAVQETLRQFAERGK